MLVEYSTDKFVSSLMKKAAEIKRAPEENHYKIGPKPSSANVFATIGRLFIRITDHYHLSIT